MRLSACLLLLQSAGSVVPAPRAPATAVAPGNLFVTAACIDCDVCRWMAPATFGRLSGQSVVVEQPQNEDDEMKAYAACQACPVGAIRLQSPRELVKAVDPIVPIDATRLPGVYHIAHHAASSFGATSYLLQTAGRPSSKVLGSKAVSGVVLVDSPRYSARLADSIERRFGAPDWMVLTHSDDVADHAKWRARFPSLRRAMHAADATGDLRREVEVLLVASAPGGEGEGEREGEGEEEEGEGGEEGERKGEGARRAEGGSHNILPFELLPDVWMLATPGHTRGSVSVLYSPSPAAPPPGTPPSSGSSSSSSDSALFSGDHLAQSDEHEDEDEDEGQLTGFFDYNWWSVDRQRKSILGLRDLRFDWLLPGHGRRCRFGSDEERVRMLTEAASE